MSVLFKRMSVCPLHAWCHGGQMRVGTGVTDGRDLPGECWEYNWGLWKTSQSIKSQSHLSSPGFIFSHVKDKRGKQPVHSWSEPE